MNTSIPKYLVYDGKVRMGFSIDYHNELLPNNPDKSLIKGGGRIDVNHEQRKILFYGQSAEFGPCKKEDFMAAIPESWISPSLVGYKIYWAEATYPLDPATSWAKAEEVMIVPE